jgi:CDP-diacylglycerol pyrophosphatase
MRLILLSAVLLVPAAAFARQPALHDIAWYAAHDRERQVTLRMCHNNQTLQLASDDCANAERAEATAVFKGTDRDPLAYLDNPAYYSANPIIRRGVLNACQHPENPGNQMYIAHCAAARASAESEGTR